VKLLARYLADEGEKESVLSTLGSWLQDPACSNNTTLLLMAAVVYQAEGNLVDALKCCHSSSHLELMATSVQIFLKMDRPDVAEKKLKEMMAIDDDATCTQLAQVCAANRHTDCLDTHPRPLWGTSAHLQTRRVLTAVWARRRRG